LAIGAPPALAGWPEGVPVGLLAVLWLEEPVDVVVAVLPEDVDEEAEPEVLEGVVALAAMLGSVVPASVRPGAAALGFRKVADAPAVDPVVAVLCLVVLPAVRTGDGKAAWADTEDTPGGLMTAAAITASAATTCGYATGSPALELEGDPPRFWVAGPGLA
jgi:hypothetical protein